MDKFALGPCMLGSGSGIKGLSACGWGGTADAEEEATGASWEILLILLEGICSLWSCILVWSAFVVVLLLLLSVHNRGWTKGRYRARRTLRSGESIVW